MPTYVGAFWPALGQLERARVPTVRDLHTALNGTHHRRKSVVYLDALNTPYAQTYRSDDLPVGAKFIVIGAELDAPTWVAQVSVTDTGIEVK